MDKLSPHIVNEIAQSIDCGDVVFYHKKTREIICLPQNHLFDYDMEELFKKEIEEIEANRNNFIEFEPPTSSEGFRIMARFAELLPNSLFKFELLEILERNKPFRNFKYHVDNSEYRQNWFDFKQKELEKMVEQRFESEL